jgi:hypothetical protein
MNRDECGRGEGEYRRVEEKRGKVRKWADVPLHLPIFGLACGEVYQTLIPDTLAVKPKASQSTDGNLLWSVVYISDTACLRVGAADDTQAASADPHPLRQPWPVTGGYAAGVP